MDEEPERQDEPFDALEAIISNYWQKRSIREIIERYEEFIIERQNIRDDNLETLLQKQMEKGSELERLLNADPQNTEWHHRFQTEITDLELQKGNERTGFWRDVASIIPRILDLEREYKDLSDGDRLK